MTARMVVAAILGAALAAPALAAPAYDVGSEPTVAVVDLYLKGVEGRATGDYARAVSDALKGMGRYAVLDRDEVANRFRAVLITPVHRLQEERLTDIERLVREGDQLVYTDPKAAVDVLSRARAELESIAEGLSANDRLRAEFLKTQMLLARSHLDTGNEARAGDILKEVIRLYGDDLEVTDRDYHPRLVKLFQRVKAGMKAERTAVVAVQTPEPGCTVVLDGRPLEGETPREYRNLYPGLHYLQVRCGSAESMIRRVVLGRERLSLLVDVPFETVLTVEGGRLGLTFDDLRQADDRAVAFAAKFGELVGADLVVLQGLTEDGARSEVRGRLVDVKRAAEVRQASVPAKANVVTPSSVKALVDALTSDRAVAVAPAAKPVEAKAAPAKQPKGWDAPAKKGGRKAWYENYYGWIATAVAAGGLAWGAYETAVYFDAKKNVEAAYPEREPGQTLLQYRKVLLDENEWKKDEAARANQASTFAIVGYSVGGAALVGGIVLFVLTDDLFPAPKDAPRAVVVPLGTPGGGGLALTARF